MQKLFLPLILFLITAAILYVGYQMFIANQPGVISPLGKQLVTSKPKPLQRYSFENLQTTAPEASTISIDSTISSESGFTSYLFSYPSDGKKITGQFNLPKGTPPSDGFPIILMIRGYIDPETYQTGAGTRHASAAFATAGFATIAPDFLGYGGSDDPDPDPVAARLHHPYDLMVLINALSTIPYALDPSRLGIWGHSNGGQIALSLVEITAEPYPTVLWAPVSKPFPYSILYYTDEYDDYGKALRRELANFEADYNVDDFSIHPYYEWIKAIFQIHQGTADDAIPVEWTDDLVQTLQDLKLTVTYYKYPGADHDLSPSWDTVVNRDIQFYKNQLQ